METPDTEPTDRRPVIPFSRAILAEALGIAAGIGESLVEGGGSLIDRVATEADRIREDGKDPSASRIEKLAANATERVCAALEGEDWIHSRNIRSLPSLVLRDRHADKEAKRLILKNLHDNIAGKAPLSDSFHAIVNAAFRTGIEPDRLVKFMESDAVLGMAIDKIIKSLSQENNALKKLERISESIKNAVRRMRHKSGQLRKLEVTEQREHEIMELADDLKDSFDPKSGSMSIASWIELLEEEMSDDDIIGWIRENKQVLIAIIRGYGSGEDPRRIPKKRRHVLLSVMENYEEKARECEDSRRQYMHLISGNYFRYEGQRPRVTKDGVVGKTEPRFVLDATAMCELWEDTIVRKLRKGDLGRSQLRSEICEACKTKIGENGGYPQRVLIKHRRRKKGKIEYKEETKVIKLLEDVEEMINEMLPIVSSYFDVAEFLQDPTRVSPQMEEEYKECFGEDGNIDQETYRKRLTKIFALVEEVDGEETLVEEDYATVERRLRTCFMHATKYNKDLKGRLGIVDGPGTPDVANTHNFARLIEIACKSPSKEDRFAARRKMELCYVIYSCKYCGDFAQRKHNAKQMKHKIETVDTGILVDRTQPMYAFSFVEYPETGEVKILSKDTKEEELPGGGIVTEGVKLIPATFGKEEDGETPIKCHLLPASSESEDERETDPYEYMGVKSLDSMVTKLLRPEKYENGSTVPQKNRARDINDIVRMTIVAEDIENLEKIQKHLEKFYFSVGQTLKRENRYGELVNVPTSGVAENSAKSDDYRTLRYVGEIPIRAQNVKPTPEDPDQGIFFKPIEIRIMLKEDLAKEKSLSNKASHERYEEDRSVEVVQRLNPIEVSEELYESEKMRKTDLFRNIRPQRFRLRHDSQRMRKLRELQTVNKSSQTYRGMRRRPLRRKPKAA